MVADPLDDRADELVKNELRDLKRRLRRCDLVIAPQIPKHYTWYEHDVYIDAEDADPKGSPIGFPFWNFRRRLVRYY